MARLADPRPVLARPPGEGRPGLDRAELAASAAAWRWVRAQAARDPGFRLQLDEPCLGLVLTDDDRRLRDAAYADAALGLTETPIVTVQFGEADPDTIEMLGRLGFAVQVPLASLPRLAGTTAWSVLPELVVSVMDGRSVWADRYAPVQQALAALGDEARTVRIVPSTSLMFLPYTVEGEDLPAGFQFAREKARTLAAWGTLQGLRAGAHAGAARHVAAGGTWKPRLARPNVPRPRRTSTCRPTRPRPSVRCPRPPTSGSCG